MSSFRHHFCGTFLAFAQSAAGQTREPIHLASDPTLSPDGATLAFSWKGEIWAVGTSVDPSMDLSSGVIQIMDAGLLRPPTAAGSCAIPANTWNSKAPSPTSSFGPNPATCRGVKTPSSKRVLKFCSPTRKNGNSVHNRNCVRPLNDSGAKAAQPVN